MGISIKDAPLVERLSGGEKMPISDGSGIPKSATAGQMKEYVNNGMASEVLVEEKLKGKVDKVDGKQLSTEDFTTLLKQKLDGLSNYDDTAIQKAVSKLRADLDKLVGGDTTTAIETFNEVIAFLFGLKDTEDLAGIIASIEKQIGEKQDGLVSGTNIKTINGQSLLGSGNIVIEGEGEDGSVDLTGYATESWVNGKLTGKVDKVDGKQLSTEDFTTTLKNKLDGLSNYDDTTISEAIEKLRTDFDTLVSGDTTTAIKTFNEIIAFLDGIEDSTDLNSIIASIEQQIAGKMDKVTLAAVATSGSYNDLSDKPTFPDAVTESTVSGWGFTKNTGTVTGVKMNGTTKNPSNGVVDLGTVITAHQDISGKQDKVLKFTNVNASAWVSDTTYNDYPYRCDMTCTGVTSDMYAEVVFSVMQANGGDYAPICETKTNMVSIWSKQNVTITVPTIIITK